MITTLPAVRSQDPIFEVVAVVEPTDVLREDVGDALVVVRGRGRRCAG